MAKKPARLHFSESELTDPKIQRAAQRAEKAADKAEKAVGKLSSKKKKGKLRMETDASASRKAKLRFEKADTTEMTEHPSRSGYMVSRGAAAMLSSRAHHAISEYEEDNVGVQAVQGITQGVETTTYTVDHAIYSHKLKAHDKADKLVRKSDQANVDALYEVFKKENPDAGSNPLSRWRQKQAIKKEYAAARAGDGTARTAEATAKGSGNAATGTKSFMEKATEFARNHSRIMLIVFSGVLLFTIISGMFSSCSAMFSSGTQVVLGTSFTAETEDILGVDEDYSALESALRREINDIERTHSGYDEYRYELDEINHNPYELAAYLTVKFEDYTRLEVQSTLQWLFNQQYELTLTEEVEIRTRTETRTSTSTDPETGDKTREEYEVEVEYEYYILTRINRNSFVFPSLSCYTKEKTRRKYRC